ncbi:hypothetical protein DRO61_04890 [Candidatus Bathyarchaeota archaeon]|nr:MAG: hypothetical protein DRO61_04890 [Candidatus Bathyarchaeota archaeon]
MIIEINAEAIVDSLESEEELLESSVAESLYAIRRLKVAVKLKTVEVKEFNRLSGQVYIDEFEIWLSKDHYKEIKA